MKALKTSLGAVITGAIVYILLASAWTACRDSLGSIFSGHWAVVINSSLIYLICISAGVASAGLSKQDVFISGFCSAAIGEMAHGLLGLMQAWYHAGIAGMLNYPPGSLINIPLNGIPAGILGAAGGATAVVIFRLNLDKA